MGGLGNDMSGGFNGGGQGAGSNFWNKGAGGGGATDVRIKIDSSSAVKILVAGGGGGSNAWQEYFYSQIVTSGVGGGLEGGKGTVCLGAGQSEKTDSTCTAGSLGKGAGGTSQRKWRQNKKPKRRRRRFRLHCSENRDNKRNRSNDTFRDKKFSKTIAFHPRKRNRTPRKRSHPHHFCHSSPIANKNQNSALHH